ncbi:hypothetical protein [Celeribacter arenosi]|uniref:hypothetical protein n=1 Tax=Celeribacter arenosi TaxID=792649 RepID=UPI0031D8E355
MSPEVRRATLSAQIATYQSDPAVVAFLTEEAMRAGVKSIRPVPAGGVPVLGKKIQTRYGMATNNGMVYVNAENDIGRSVANIAHEIAHVGNFERVCGGHTSRWLAAYHAIALRYMARFPGATWAGKRPVDEVMRNKSRYGIGDTCP